jgi:hypothetical protein
MAGDDPFGEALRVGLVGVLHHGVEDVQGNRSLVRGVGNAAGRAALGGLRRAFGRDGGFKRGDVRAEVRDEIGGQSQADEVGAECGGIGLESAGGIEQGLIAVAVGHEEFAGDGGGAHQHERVRRVDDSNHVVMQMHAPDGFGHDAGMGLFPARNLRGAETAEGGNGSGDDGELLPANARRRKVGGVSEAKGGDVFEGGNQAVGFLFHNLIRLNFLGDGEDYSGSIAGRNYKKARRKTSTSRRYRVIGDASQQQPVATRPKGVAGCRPAVASRETGVADQR